MAGKSPVKASDEQQTALESLAASRERGEADRARAVLLTLNGWTSARIAEAFGVREDTVRLWRSDFMRGGVEGLQASIAPGPLPLKTEAALRVITPLLEAPVANRPNWTHKASRVGIALVQHDISAFWAERHLHGGKLVSKRDASLEVSIADAMRHGGVDRIEQEKSTTFPDDGSYAHNSARVSAFRSSLTL
jgi:transposase